MFGEKCLDLVKEAARDSVDLIIPYNKPLVDEVLREMVTISRTLYESLSSEGGGSDADNDRNAMNYRNRLLVNKVYLRAFLWNKRCLLSYHNHRLGRLKKIRWEIGAVLPNEVKENLSEDEIQWFLNYSKNLSEYMGDIEKGNDLTLKRFPPKQLYIQVRCLAEFGNLELEDGSTIVLSKDSMHYLPLSKCEKLIHQGILEQID